MNIKYRAWDKKNRIMRNISGLKFDCNGELYAIEIMMDGQNLTVDPNDYILQQSLGIKDINNIEIYEDDILRLGKNPQWYSHVKYLGKHNSPSFDVELTPDTIYDINVIYHEKRHGRLEVIGNVHENPVYSRHNGIVQQN